MLLSYTSQEAGFPTRSPRGLVFKLKIHLLPSVFVNQIGRAIQQ